MRTAKAAFALFLALSISVRAETTTDPLWYLLSTYVLAPDAKAVEAEGEGSFNAKGLAALQSDLLLLSDGLESFRDESQVKETLTRLEPRMSPELRPFFKDRASSLDAIYRTLAATDYTWALLFPEPPCEPIEARRKLLAGRDGLFQTETGKASPWLVALFGQQAEGKSAEQALDQASSQAKLTGADYENLRARVRKLTLALASEKAVGADRSKLYCARAAAFTGLAAAQRMTKTGPIAAGRSVGPGPEESVFIVRWKDQWAAASLLKTKGGLVLITDAAIVDDTDNPDLFAYSKNFSSVALKTTVLRRHQQLSVAVLSYTEHPQRPALALTEKSPSRGELVTAVGHAMVSGPWTKTSGLVTKVGDSTFQTDASISPDLSGAPVLNEAGEVAGMLVLRPADTEEGRWPVAIPAPVLTRWLDDPGFVPVAAPATEAIEDTGTAAVLSRTRPGALTEAGLGAWNIPGLPPPPPTPHGVCVGNCESPRSPGSSYSRGSSSNAGAEALGEALGELALVAIFKGIPALFQGIGSLFKSKPGMTPGTTRGETAQARPTEPKKPPEPPKITGLTLTITPGDGLEGETLSATAVLSFSGDNPKKDGISVVFTDDGNGKILYPNNQSSYSKPTNASGRVTISFELSAKERDRQQPFDELKDEERRRAGEEVPLRLRPDRKPKNSFEKVKQRTQGAFDSLDNEETSTEAEENSSGQTVVPEEEAVTPGDLTSAAVHLGPAPVPHSMPQMDAPLPLGVLATLTMTASVSAGSLGSANGNDKVKVMSDQCPPGMEAAEPRDSGLPGHPPMGSPHKAMLEEKCLPFEREAEKACGKDQPCRNAKLRSLGYDFRECLHRWGLDGSGATGSIGSPSLLKPNKRLRCVRRSQSGGQARTRELALYAQKSGADGDGEEDKAKKASVIRRALDFIENIIKNPDFLKGKKPEEIAPQVEVAPNWKIEKLGDGAHKGLGWLLREYHIKGKPTGRMIRWHPGGGHHGPGSYWRVTSPAGGVSERIP